MRTRSIVVTLGLLTVATAFGDWLATAYLRQRMAAEARRVSTLRAAVATAEAEVATQQKALRATEDKLDAIEAEIAVEKKYGPAPAQVWAERVSRLKALLAQRSDGNIPELALLQPKDWIDAAVRAEGATPAKLAGVLAALDRTARARLGEKLHDALVKFVEQSQGQLPTDLRQLLPFADPNVTEQMLDGYEFTRAGQAGAKDEKILQRKIGHDDFSISLNGSSYSSSVSGDDLPDADELLSGLAGDSSQGDLGNFVETMRRTVDALEPVVKSSFLDAQMEALTPKLKAGIKQYQDVHGGQYPPTIAEISRYLDPGTKVAELFRPVFANLFFAMEHDGNMPANSTQLQRYLDAWSDERVLRQLIIKPDGTGLTMNFNVSE